MDRVDKAVISNTHLRHILTAIQQVIGDKAAKDIYRTANYEALLVSFPPDDLNDSIPALDFAQILQTIEMNYELGGKTILRRIGKACFHLVLRQEMTRMRLVKRVLSTMPKEQHLELILEPIVDIKKKLYPQGEVWLEEKEHSLAVIEQNCLECYQRISTGPVCHLTSGMIDEAILWATGKIIESRETDCIAKGDVYCRFEVAKWLPQKVQPELPHSIEY